MKKSKLKKEIAYLQDKIDELEHEEIMRQELNKGVLRIYKESNAVFTELDDDDPTGQKFVGLYLNEDAINSLIEILDYNAEEEEKDFDVMTDEEGHEPECHIWHSLRHIIRLLIKPTVIS